MVIDDSTKQKVRSLHSFFFYRHLYYDDNEGGGKTEAALLKLFKQHGHTWLLTIGSAEFVSTRPLQVWSWLAGEAAARVSAFKTEL